MQSYVKYCGEVHKNTKRVCQNGIKLPFDTPLHLYIATYYSK